MAVPHYVPRALAAQGVEVHEVPGDHYSMVREPHVRVLAERIRARLEGAISGSTQLRSQEKEAPGSRPWSPVSSGDPERSG
jgi:hypothetical protein